MDPFEILFYVLILALGAFMLWILGTKKIEMPTRYKIKAIVLNSGCNIHKDFTTKELPADETIKIDEEEKTLKIKVEDLWRVKVRFYRRIIYFLTGVKGPYLCLYRVIENEIKAIDGIEIKASPVLIRNVKKSRILTKAFKEMFKGEVRGIGRFIVVLGITLIIIYVASQMGIIGGG